MSLLGKILAVLNILGVLGLAALAAMTYGKRRAWEHANFLHVHLVYGLPIDDADPGDKETKGLNVASRYTESTLKQLFPADPKGTQTKEAESVRDKLQGQLGALDSDRPAQTALLARWLQPLAKTGLQHELYVSAERHLKDEPARNAFKLALRAAMPPALQAVRFDPKRLSFENVYQDTLRDLPTLELKKLLTPEQEKDKALLEAIRDLPGDDKWDLALAFLKKLPREGVTFDKAAEAAKKKAEEVEGKAKAKEDAELKLDEAKTALFIAIAEAKADPTPDKKRDQNDKQKKMEDAQKDLADAEAAAKLLPDPREAAAVAFLEIMRKETKDKNVTEADFIKKVVDAVFTEMVDDVHDELSKRYEQLVNEAVSGTWLTPEGTSSNAEPRRRRQNAIARFLLLGLEVLHPDVMNSDLEEASKQAGSPYRRFINVVGLKEAVQAVNEQYAGLRTVYDEIAQTLSKERVEFWTKHNRKLDSLATRAKDIDRLVDRLQDVSKQANEQEGIYKKEEERVKLYLTELQASRDETAKEMATLNQLTGGLFQVRIAIRDAIRNNEKYLVRIRELEEEVRYLEGELKKQTAKKKTRTTTP